MPEQIWQAHLTLHSIKVLLTISSNYPITYVQFFGYSKSYWRSLHRSVILAHQYQVKDGHCLEKKSAMASYLLIFHGITSFLKETHRLMNAPVSSIVIVTVLRAGNAQERRIQTVIRILAAMILHLGPLVAEPSLWPITLLTALTLTDPALITHSPRAGYHRTHLPR